MTPGRWGWWVGLLGAAFVLASLSQRPFAARRPALRPRAKGPRTILTWSGFWGVYSPSLYFAACPELMELCPMTRDRAATYNASAIVFLSDHFPRGLPDAAQRQAFQRYVFFCMEAAEVVTKFVDLARFAPHFFNWTMTFRRDSDVVLPYGGGGDVLLNASAARPPRDPAELVAGKTSEVVWPVSHCATRSRREVVARGLAKRMRLEIVGKCSGMGEERRHGCPKSRYSPFVALGPGQGEECLRQLISKSYFFLALENSVCTDYVSEKFWFRYTLPSVPVVLSRAVMEPLAPPNSFVAVDDFATMEDLVRHLKELIAQPKRYAAYLAWQTQGYQRAATVAGRRIGLCGLCEKLLEDDDEPKSYPSIKDFYITQAGCSGSQITDRF